MEMTMKMPAWLQIGLLQDAAEQNIQVETLIQQLYDEWVLRGRPTLGTYRHKKYSRKAYGG